MTTVVWPKALLDQIGVKDRGTTRADRYQVSQFSESSANKDIYRANADITSRGEASSIRGVTVYSTPEPERAGGTYTPKVTVTSDDSLPPVGDAFNTAPNTNSKTDVENDGRTGGTSRAYGRDGRTTRGGATNTGRGTTETSTRVDPNAVKIRLPF